jgi:hypothetical protein
MNSGGKRLERALKILEDYRTKAQSLENEAKRRDRREAAHYHEGRSSGFKEAMDVLRQEFELGGE